MKHTIAMVLLLALVLATAVAQPTRPPLRFAVNTPRTLTVRWGGDASAAAWWVGTGPAVFYRPGPGPHAVILGPDAYRAGDAVRVCAIRADASQNCWDVVPTLVYLPIVRTRGAGATLYLPMMRR
jgi:hypothetical protein